MADNKIIFIISVFIIPYRYFIYLLINKINKTENELSAVALGCSSDQSSLYQHREIN